LSENINSSLGRRAAEEGYGTNMGMRIAMAMAAALIFWARAADAASAGADGASRAGAASAASADSVKADSSNGWGYGYDSLLRDLEVWRKDTNVKVDSIGASVQNRALWMVSITAPGDSVGRGGDMPQRKRRVFIHARTHPAEVQAFWVIREAMRFLLSGDTAAARLRRDFIFNFVPMYNPDGVELGKARWNAHDSDLESNWDARPMEPEPTALKRTFMDFMSGPIPIEVALNLHSDQYNCSRFFFFHYAEGTSERYTELEKTYIGGVRSYYPAGIKDWSYVKSWQFGTVTHYPEGFWWVNHGDKVMALTYEDNNSITTAGMKCPPASGFDTTGMALVLGSTDYLEGRSVSPILARRAPVTRMLLTAEGLRFPPGSASRWEVLDPRGRRLGSGSIGPEGGLVAWRELPEAPMRILSVRPESGPVQRSILPFR
jgi:hypothetical protein